MDPKTHSVSPSGWQRFAAGTLGAFHSYASWLVSISWKRFFLLSILLLVTASLLESIPPFNIKFTEVLPHEEPDTRTAGKAPKPPKPPAAPGRSEPLVKIERPATADKDGVDISIDDRGVRITKRVAKAEQAASAASAAQAEAAEAAGAAASAASSVAELERSVEIRLPPGVASEVKAAVEEARREVAEAIAEAEEAKRDAQEAQREAEAAAREGVPRLRTRTTRLGEFLPDLALLWIFASAIIKITYKGQLQAEVKAAHATEVAEAESLKRQVVEARMAAMQAQVEPHFLFNTLASIDHLIETDPPRASKMQKNLIALLRASMPTMREANANGTRDLGRELAVIRPYLEILKVRMEDRLQTEIDVPEGLMSAEFPPMMLQSLVENAIKHGLEPKPEGGLLRVSAEIVHGKLAITVADTGLGFGKAATAGTGTGLANIRERLLLLFGTRGQLKIAENTPSGTVVTITVPYQTRVGDQDVA
jgi:hypothetical protein